MGRPAPGGHRTDLVARAAELGLDVRFSRPQGALQNLPHRADFDVAIVNAGGLTHTSVALRDALLAVHAPVHRGPLHRPATRESFRKVNLLSDVALESIVGKGAEGYHLALDFVARRSADAGPWLAPRGRHDRRSCAVSAAASDAVDRRVVGLLNERTQLARSVGKVKAADGGCCVLRDVEREREALRATMANVGPLPQALAAPRHLPPAHGCGSRRRGPRPEIDHADGGDPGKA